MASTYSPSLRIQLIETGTENEAWGQPLDNNLGTVIEQAIVGSNTISLTNLTTYTLTTANASPDQARNAVLVFDGALSANCNVIAPSVKKVYVVSNKTTGGYFVNIKTSSGNAVSVINGTNQLVYCDGTDFKSAVNINTIIGDLSISGGLTANNTVFLAASNNTINTVSSNLSFTSNSSIVSFAANSGGLIPPRGTTAQRPPVPKLGMQRWNQELGWLEMWNGVIWYPLTGSYGIQYVVVAGGGSGGTTAAGGGGAGGALVGGTVVQSGTAYTVTIGAGGSIGSNGANTFALGFTTIGGGRGGDGPSSSPGANGGSGGGGGGGQESVPPGPIGKVGGTGTTGQGNSGGKGGDILGGSDLAGGAGGGGAGGAGSNGANANNGDANGGAGGIGISSTSTGSLVYYAGGGGGGPGNGTGGAGGLGGGGAGGTGTRNAPGNGIAGTANTGGGGGGGTWNGSGAAGGSGIAVFVYASPSQLATGGTVTSYSSGGLTYWVHTFNSSGTFTA